MNSLAKGRKISKVNYFVRIFSKNKQYNSGLVKSEFRKDFVRFLEEMRTR